MTRGESRRSDACTGIPTTRSAMKSRNLRRPDASLPRRCVTVAADRSDRLADSIEHSAIDLVAELQAVRDGVEELYILLDHIWRNRDELRDILAELVESGSVQAPTRFRLRTRWKWA